MTLAARYRGLFPSLEAQTYLNSCAHGAQSTRARAAVERFLREWAGGADWAAWTAAMDEARAEFARLIGAHADEVAITANASAALSSIASALDFTGPRREVVTTEIDFPTAPYVWNLQRARGAVHTHLKAPTGVLRPDEVAARLSDRVALVSMPHVASFNGYRLDVARLARDAHAHGALLLVDGFQAAGTFPVDVKALDVDVYVTGTYKWLLGVSGCAFMYVRRELHDRLRPTVGGWLAQDAPYAFDPLAPSAKDARAYQYGGASIPGMYMAIEGMRLLQEAGLAAIERENFALTDRVIAACDARGYEVLTPRAHADRSPGIVTFRPPRVQDALAALARENVIVNSRLGGIRVSPHFYNTPDEIDRLFEVIDRAVAA